MSKTNRFIDSSDRDWLSVSTGAGMGGAGDIISDDISTLLDFLQGEPIATKEIRAAIVRILQNGWDTLGRGRALICILFDRNCAPAAGWSPAWTVDFKRIDGGQSNLSRDISLAAAIQAVRDCGKSYEEAIEWAVKQSGLGTRRVQQISKRCMPEPYDIGPSSCRQLNLSS
jgi:hypothetical protein